MTGASLGAFAAVASVLVGIAAILVALYLDARRARRHRISEVVDEYVDLCAGPPVVATGPRAFVRAGARLLEDDDEVREAIRQIVARVGEARHPLGGHRTELPDDVDLKTEVVDRLDEDGGNLCEICEELD